MSILMTAVKGQTEGDSDDEKPWKVNAVNLVAANYPKFSTALIKYKGADKTVPQLDLYASSVLYKEYTTLADAQTEAGERFEDAVLELINEKSKELTVKAARAVVRDVLTFGQDESTHGLVENVGANIQWFAEPESKSGKPTIRASLLAKVDSMEGASDSDKLAALMAALRG